MTPNGFPDFWACHCECFSDPETRAGPSRAVLFAEGRHAWRHNYHREHMRDGSSPNVKLKKYLYIARSLLCCRWIERDPAAGPPPMQFLDALNAANISADLRAAIDALVERRKPLRN